MTELESVIAAGPPERIARDVLLADIDAFNTANPGRRIAAMHLQASVRARRRRIAEAEQGVYLPRNRREAIEEGRFGRLD